MSNKIKFVAANEYGWNIAPRPYPSSQAVPQWWKDMTPYIVDEDNPDGKKLLIKNLRINASPKKCMPMLDSITSGYIIPLWADIQVRSASDSEYIPNIFWKTEREVFEAHIDGAGKIQVPDGYCNSIFKFINMWTIKTPPGYSIMISSPVGHNDIPFKCVPAIVDTDKYDAALPTPVFLKDGFEGIVERGTPMIQVTPFKRESWESEFDLYKGNEYLYKQEKYLKAVAFGNYIKTQWSKKSYK
jgi:hypothetical protein